MILVFPRWHRIGFLFPQAYLLTDQRFLSSFILMSLKWRVSISPKEYVIRDPREVRRSLQLIPREQSLTWGRGETQRRSLDQCCICLFKPGCFYKAVVLEMHLGQGKMMERWFCTEACKNYMDLNQDDKPRGHFLATFSPPPSFWIWLRSSGSIQDCFIQPRICYILLFKTKSFWVFLSGFILLCILSFPPSKFGFIVLLLPAPRDNSCWTAAHPTCLQSPILHWLAVRLNIFLCTFPLNKDFSSSALCASVSLHTPCLLFLLCPSKTVGSSLPLQGFAIQVTPTSWLSRAQILFQTCLWFFSLCLSKKIVASTQSLCSCAGSERTALFSAGTNTTEALPSLVLLVDYF